MLFQTTNMLDWSKLKPVTGNKLSVTKMVEKVLEKVKNI